MTVKLLSCLFLPLLHNQCKLLRLWWVGCINLRIFFHVASERDGHCWLCRLGGSHVREFFWWISNLLQAKYFIIYMAFVVTLSSCFVSPKMISSPMCPLLLRKQCIYRFRRHKTMFPICIVIGFLLTLQRWESRISVPLACLSARRANLKFHGDRSNSELIQTDWAGLQCAKSFSNTAAQQV